MDYIQNPRDHFIFFIRDEVSRYITDQFSVSVLPKMKENIEVLQQKIMNAAHASTKHVLVNRGDAGLWLKSFTRQLSDELIFSEKNMTMKHDDVDDFNLLEDMIRKDITAVISVISTHFSDFLWRLDYKNRPDEILIDHFCQCCWVQCPFCKATCTNTIENHEEDHNVDFHRINGLNGFYYDETQNFCTEFCSSVMKSGKSFKSSENWIPFEKYKTVHAKWRITPNLSELPYWKWFLCRFQNDLEKYYEKSFQGNGEIPPAWRKCSKEEALASLEASDTLNNKLFGS